MSSSRESNNKDKQKRQNITGGVFSRYAQIDQLSKDEVENKKIPLRLKALKLLKIENGLLTLKDGSQEKIRRIRPDGFIVLMNWKMIDPLELLDK
jgi:hypothetical protein